MKKLFRVFESAAKKKERLTEELKIAVDVSNPDIGRVRELLRDGADPNKPIGPYTALHRASLGSKVSLEAVNVLLEAGGNPFVPVQFGLKKYKLSNLVINRPDIKDRLLKAEADWERVHGPQPPIIGICSLPRRKAS